MPTNPHKGEDQNAFMKRCVPELMGDGKREQVQAVAACLNIWRQGKKSASGGPLLVIPLDKAWSAEAREAAAEARKEHGQPAASGAPEKTKKTFKQLIAELGYNAGYKTKADVLRAIERKRKQDQLNADRSRAQDKLKV